MDAETLRLRHAENLKRQRQQKAAAAAEETKRQLRFGRDRAAKDA
jgi:hypothetical protein